jgi:radical SAM superfamily enzyme YgiQ (UPF0313 family)
MIENITQQFLNMIELPDSSYKKLNYLIVMPSQADMRSQYYFPIGMGIVSSCLKASGRTVFTLNLTYKENPQELLKKTIIDNEIDVLLTGGLSGEYAQICEIINITKGISDSIITLVGGGIITADPETAMKALEKADYGIIGEGEITVNALAYVLETDSNSALVEGVITKRGSDYELAPKRGEIANLDCLPFPDYDGFDYAEMFERKYSGTAQVNSFGISLAASRSCPYNCTFCFHSSGEKYRRRSLDSVFKEIEWIKSKFSFEHIHIADELFGNDLAWVSEFCARIKPYGVTYLINTRLDRIQSNPEILDLLKDSGCKEILFGVEHVSETILKSMRKKISPKLIEPVFNECLQKGITPKAQIIFGDLEETPETVREALDWWGQHRKYRINLDFIIVFPGSHIYKIACELGIIKDPVKYLQEGCPLINITQMSDNEWKLMKKEIICFRYLNANEDVKIELTQLAEALILLSRDHKVCVWPALDEDVVFFQSISEFFCDNVYFINRKSRLRDVESADRKDLATPIYNPDVILKEGIEIVICPRNTLITEIRSICKNDYPCVKKVLSIYELANWQTV